VRGISRWAGSDKFSPVGNWVGSYICSQGYTGATLSIAHLHGDNFEGAFHFYPTARNPSVPNGRYTVYGQYDRLSHRILINPGKWLQRPRDYYNTVIVGSFDPIGKNLSAYFQGINGCTSFEAKYDKSGHEPALAGRKAAKKHKIKKDAAAASTGVAQPTEAPIAATPAPAAPAATPPAPTVAAPTAAPQPATVAPPAATAVPAPAPAATGSSAPPPAATSAAPITK
jgi:hypothetical protein